MIRKDQSDLIYKNEEAKFKMVVADIMDRHKKGQPILVGTTSVEKSEYLSKLLAKAGVRHEVLNAKNNAREAVIVAKPVAMGPSLWQPTWLVVELTSCSAETRSSWPCRKCRNWD